MSMIQDNGCNGNRVVEREQHQNEYQFTFPTY